MAARMGIEAALFLVIGRFGKQVISVTPNFSHTLYNRGEPSRAALCMGHRARKNSLGNPATFLPDNTVPMSRAAGVSGLPGSQGRTSARLPIRFPQ